MRILPLLAFLGIVLAAALVGSLSTLDASGQYEELDQPSWAPPSWLFGPVWTVLYAMIAVAAWRAWLHTGTRSQAMAWWGIQLVGNALWSPLFFAWELRGAAFAWIIALDIAIAFTVWRFWRADRVAAGLMMPYQAWVLFATALNGAVWWLNRS